MARSTLLNAANKLRLDRAENVIVKCCCCSCWLHLFQFIPAAINWFASSTHTRKHVVFLFLHYYYYCCYYFYSVFSTTTLPRQAGSQAASSLDPFSSGVALASQLAIHPGRQLASQEGSQLFLLLDRRLYFFLPSFLFFFLSQQGQVSQFIQLGTSSAVRLWPLLEVGLLLDTPPSAPSPSTALTI